MWHEINKAGNNGKPGNQLEDTAVVQAPGDEGLNKMTTTEMKGRILELHAREASTERGD